MNILRMRNMERRIWSQNLLVSKHTDFFKRADSCLESLQADRVLLDISMYCIYEPTRYWNRSKSMTVIRSTASAVMIKQQHETLPCIVL